MAALVQGGETNALSRMSEWMADKQRVAEFEKPKGNPAAFSPPATTVLSPFLKFGCLSARLFHAKIAQVGYSQLAKLTYAPKVQQAPSRPNLLQQCWPMTFLVMSSRAVMVAFMAV